MTIFGEGEQNITTTFDEKFKEFNTYNQIIPKLPQNASDSKFLGKIEKIDISFMSQGSNTELRLSAIGVQFLSTLRK